MCFCPTSPSLNSDATKFMQVGTILKTLNIYSLERQVDRWVKEIDEDEPTGFVVYEKFEALVLDDLNFIIIIHMHSHR